MSRHVSWRAGGPADRFYIPADLDDLSAFLGQLPESEPLLFVPRNFAAKVKEVVEPRLQSTDGAVADRAKRTIEHAEDKYFSRMGWMTRAHPVELPGAEHHVVVEIRKLGKTDLKYPRPMSLAKHRPL